MDDIESMMKEVDKDSSGEISFQEFVNLMMRDKKNEDILSSERKHRPAVQGGNHRIEGLHGNFSSIADIANAFDKYRINDTRAYRKGGDRRMQTQESLRKRKEIREYDAVQRALDNYWNGISEGSHYLYKDQVLGFQMRLCKALFDDDDWDVTFAQRVVEEDWEREHGKEKKNVSKSRMFKEMCKVGIKFFL